MFHVWSLGVSGEGRAQLYMWAGGKASSLARLPIPALPGGAWVRPEEPVCVRRPDDPSGVDGDGRQTELRAAVSTKGRRGQYLSGVSVPLPLDAGARPTSQVAEIT